MGVCVMLLGLDVVGLGRNVVGKQERCSVA